MTTAITYSALGGPDVLTVTETETAPPAPGRVVVRVTAAGVNPIDTKLRSGIRPTPPITRPRGVGADGAGVVAAVGDGVEGFRAGDAVVIYEAEGVYADEITVRPEQLAPRPPQVTDAVGAAIGIPAATAYQSLRSLAVGSGDTLLLHGGSGAVGQAVIQLAVLWGARVIATSSERRADRVRALGATWVAYGPGLADRVRAAAPDGVTVALDAAGTDEALDVSVELVADRDRVATLVRGADAAGLGIRAFRGGSPDPLTPTEQRWRHEAIPVVLGLLAAGRFDVELGPELALRDAAEAHRLVEAGTDGKVILRP